MSCRHTRRLALYQAGALTPAEHGALTEHLETCPVCRRELRALEETVRLLHQPLVPADAPAPTWAAVQARLRPRRQGASRLRQWTPVFAAALILVLIAGAVLPLVQQGGFDFGSHGEALSQVQLAAAWDTPLADKAALGLAILALDEDTAAAEVLD